MSTTTLPSPPPPPPFIPTVTDQIQPPQPSSSSSSSSTSSIIIAIIVIASAIIVSASIYLLIRCLSRRFHRSFRTSSAADDVIPSRNTNINNINNNINRNSAKSQLLNSLPLFTFSSLTGNVAGSDCAVCLSKFDREDQLRLLPLCCHAFHAECIDTWLVSNQTCPLCRSSVYPTEAEVLNKIMSVSEDQQRVNNRARNGSFRIELGSISRRRGQFDLPGSTTTTTRSYSIGSFDYIIDDGYEVSVTSMHQRGVSECTSGDKDSIVEPPGESVAVDVGALGGGGGTRNWLRDYVERVSFSISSRTTSFRGGSGRFFGSSRRTEAVVPVDDLEANRIGEEISELFRWLSGV